MRLKIWAALAAAALTLPLLGGCGDDDANKGYVRILNATTEYASLDLYKEDSSGNDDLVVSGTAAGAVSAYAGVDKGSYTFDVESASAASTAASAAGTVTKQDHATLVTYITGNKAAATYLTDEEDTPASGKAKLRVFNAASGEAASVDVYLSTNACNALTVTDTPFASAVTTLQTSYSLITTGTSSGSTWNVCVFSAGDTSTLLLDIPALTLTNQEIATLILTHTTGGVLLNASLLQQQGAVTAYPSGISRVRVAADAASASQVTVTLGDTTLTSLTTSPAVTDYETVTSGSLSGTVTIGGTTTSGFTFAPVAGNDYTLLVTGTAGAPVATLIADNNTPSTSTSSTVKARVINGVNGLTDGTTVSATIDNKSLGNAAFNGASSYVLIPATTGTSTVQSSITTTPGTLVNQTFSASGVYTVFVWGDSSAPRLSISQDR